MNFSLNISQKILLTIATLVVIGLAVLILSIIIGFTNIFSDTSAQNSYAQAAIVANGMECATIGRDIFLKNGSAADALIATLFCEGIACFQSMGLGGGFLLTMYKKDTNKVEYLDARETAPAAATTELYANVSTVKSGYSIAVPGELQGYWTLHQKYGRLSWKELVQPTIDLCREGVTVSSYIQKILIKREAAILKTPGLRKLFTNPETNQLWKIGERIKRPQLASTLQIIANEGVSALYNRNGSLTRAFVDDIRSVNGIITVEDMEHYRPIWKTPTYSEFNNHKIYSSSLPGSGPILALVFNILDGFLPKNIDKVTKWHRIVESFKFAYGFRMLMGDSDYLPGLQKTLDKTASKDFAAGLRQKIDDRTTINDPRFYLTEYQKFDDHGTANVVVVAPNGDVMVATSTINSILGSLFCSPSTGILLNNEMNDFSQPNVFNIYGLRPSVSNLVKPGKRPLSSMTPAIIFDENGQFKLAIGGAGGSKITSSVVLTILNTLDGQDIQEAIDAKRLHHQLLPMSVNVEKGFDDEVFQGLIARHHNYTVSDLSTGFASVTAIAFKDNRLHPAFDSRRGGSTAGF